MLLCKQNKYNYYNILMSYVNEHVVWKGYFRQKMNENDTLKSNSMLLNMENGFTLSENLVSKEGQLSFTVL